MNDVSAFREYLADAQCSQFLFLHAQSACAIRFEDASLRLFNLLPDTGFVYLEFRVLS